jgi:membrane fusion protein (multidrug efflux system)
MSETSHRRFPWGWLLLAALVLALAVPKVLPLLRSEAAAGAAAPAPAAEEPTLTVTAVRIEPQRLAERLTTTGTVRANERVELVSEVAGKVAEVRFEEGRRVEAGQVLVKIDDSELVAQRDRAQSRVEVAKSREKRQRRLLEDGILSQEEYDLQAGELEVLEADLRLIDARLEKTEIRAPFTGVVGLRRVSEGSYLSPQTPIATLQDTDPVKLDFALPEKYAGEVVVGDIVTFHTKGSEQLYTGTVYAIEPSVDAETRSLALRARAPNPRGELLPGAFADVELEVRVVDDALAVPAIAVIPELGGKKVFVFDGAAAESRSVTTGLRTEDLVEVTSGLAPGDLVITSGLQQLRPGLAVEVDTAEAR